MTSYPYKISKSARQNTRPKPNSASAAARASKLEEALIGHRSHSTVHQSSVPEDQQAWHSSTSFDPYNTHPESSSSHLNPNRQTSAYDNQESFDVHQPYPSPTSNPPPTATHFSIDQVSNQYDFKPQEDQSNRPQDSDYQDMSSLSFIVPTQYGAFEPYSGPQFEHSGHMMNNYQAPPPQHSQHQSPHQQPLPPASSAPQSYSQTYTSSPHMLGSSPNLSAQRRSSEQPAMQPYPNRQVSQSPYEQPPQSVRGSPASIGFAHSSPEPQHMPPAPIRSASYPNTSYAHHQGLPAPAYSATFPSPQPPYGSNSYDAYHQPGMYSHHSSGYGSPYLTSSGPDASGIGAGTVMPGQHPHSAPGGATPDQGGHVRILNTRPKPQCWEHGCNGRQFSTFSNLLRHQREKSGTASKSVCPRCGAEFTRTTARNGHMENDKCKPRRASATGSDK